MNLNINGSGVNATDDASNKHVESSRYDTRNRNNSSFQSDMSRQYQDSSGNFETSNLKGDEETEDEAGSDTEDEDNKELLISRDAEVGIGMRDLDRLGRNAMRHRC